MAGRDAEEVFERGATCDRESGEFVLREELACALTAALAFGGGDGDGFTGAVFEGEYRSGLLRAGWGQDLRVQVSCVEDESRSCGGGVEEKSAARWHVEIVGW